MKAWWLNTDRVAAGLLFLGAVLCPLRLLAAAGIEGRVINGTTGRPAAGESVELLNPGKGGMRKVATARADASGHFAFAEPPAGQSAFYLVEAVCQGVAYNQIVRPSAKPPTNLNLTIYNASARPPHLTISSARFLVRAKGGKVEVEELYGVRNASRPAVAYANPGGTFSFNLGGDTSQPSVEVVGELNTPLPQDARPGETPGQYLIQYPLKPGLTVVIVAYHADYSSQDFFLSDSVPYPIDQLEMDVVPSTLKVQSALFAHDGADPDSGGEKLLAKNLPAGAVIKADLTGEALAGTAPESGDEQTVKELANPMTRLGLPLLGCFLLVLLWAMGVRVSKEWARRGAARSGHPAQKQLEAKIEKLTNSIANLDELFEAGKLPEKRYWRERLDLKAKLVVLLKSSPPAFLDSYATRDHSS